MKTVIGIDLGSTTTKAIVLDETGQVLGRGITNSRSNYATATAVAKREALIDTRLTLIRDALMKAPGLCRDIESVLAGIVRGFRRAQFVQQLTALEAICLSNTRDKRFAAVGEGVREAIADVFRRLRDEAPALFAAGTRRRSDFFRDLAGSRFHALAEEVARGMGLPYDALLHVYDKSIIEVENQPPADEIGDMFFSALERLRESDASITVDAGMLAPVLHDVLSAEIEEIYVVGTGYGRATLPFSKEHIRSEILCHGLGAHVMYPGTRTVLDIGGQDTKAIQVDPNGIVENFQMNDRCAAGCGRYLGYIADEMNVGLHELGPMAMQSTRVVRINSTCTVFAGAELRDRLALGERREDILGGLHRAIMLRAMSIVSRSGGIRDQFTFTGGVAKNEAAVQALSKLVQENYGAVTINIHPDSIYTGALGAATFARQAIH